MRRRRVPAGSASSGQAMLEFALILPLLLVIIFISMAVSFIYATRVAEHKAAYDAARYVAKVTGTTTINAGDITNSPSLETGLSAKANAQPVVDFDYQHSWVMKTFGSPPQVKAVKTGPDVPGQPGYHTVESVEVVVTYNMLNIPGWDYMARLYGGGSIGPLTEQGIAARVVNKY